MSLHRNTHPTYVEGCFACRIATVAVGIAAMPTRKEEANRHAAHFKGMDRDMGAYKQLRNDGYQPPSIRGSHERMVTASSREEIEGLPKLWRHRDEILTGEVPNMTGSAA